MRTDMHEIELFKRIRDRLGSRVDIDSPNDYTPHESTIRRVTMAALEVLGIRVAPDGTVQMPLPPSTPAASSPSESADADGSIARRRELERRIASNKDWLSKNWHLGKEPRRDCEANIERDKRKLALLDKEAPAPTTDEEP